MTFSSGGSRVARTVTPATGGVSATLGAAATLGALAWVSDNSGGAAYLSGTNGFLATWWDGGQQIMVRAINTGGVTAAATALTTGEVHDQPDIACSPTACLVVGHTWSNLIWGRWTDLTGAPTSARFTIESGGGTRGVPHVQYSPTPAQFVVSWISNGIPVVATQAPGAITSPTATALVSGRAGTAQDLTYNSGVDLFGVVVQGAAQDVWGRPLTNGGAPLASGFTVSTVPVTTNSGLPAITSNPTTGDFLVVYTPDFIALRAQVGRSGWVPAGTPLPAGAAVALSASATFTVDVGDGGGDPTVLANNNTVAGANGLAALTTGTDSTGIGFNALKALTIGSFNTAVGSGSLAAVTTGSKLTAFGYQAAAATTSGTFLTAIGYQALFANTTGGSSTCSSTSLEITKS